MTTTQQDILELLALLTPENELECPQSEVEADVVSLRDVKIKALTKQVKQGKLEFKWSDEATEKLLQEILK